MIYWWVYETCRSDETMSPAITTKLPAKLLEYLGQGSPAILATRDEGGWPHMVMTWVVARDERTVRFDEGGWPHMVMTWVVARDERTVRFIADHNTTTSSNLERDNRASLQVIGPENILFLIKGYSQHIRDRVKAASFAMMMMEMIVTEVKDQSWPIVEVSPLAYIWLSDKKDELVTMEQAVFAELRDWEAE
jgi:hypothetical protein